MAPNRILVKGVVLVLALGMISGEWAAGVPGANAAESLDRPLTIAIPADVNTFDPHFKAALYDYMLDFSVFDTLVRFDHRTLKRVPGLAERWEVIDGKRWRFHLKKGIEFHNRKPFNAQAVKYTIDRMMDPKLKTRDNFWREVELDRVEVVDENTVDLVTKQITAIMPVRLRFVYILEPTYYSQISLEAAARKPIGAGPYRVVDWARDERIVMDAFGSFHDGAPMVKRVIWRPVPDPAARVNGLRTGEFDIVVGLSPDQAQSLEAQGVGIQRVEGTRRIFVGLRTDVPPLNDRRVRQALNYAINVEGIIERILGGGAKRMATIVNPPNHNPNLKPYAYDPVKAKALLVEAGQAEGFKVTLEFPAGNFTKDREVTLAIAADLAKVGVNVTVNPLEPSVFIDKLSRREPSPLYFYGIGSAFDGQSEIRTLQKDYFLEGTHWNNPEFEALYGRLAGTQNIRQRTELLYRLQEIVNRETPWIFLYRQVDIYGVGPRVKWQAPVADDSVLPYEMQIIRR